MTFKVADNNGQSIDPAEMDYLGITIVGPTSDYLTRTAKTIFRAPSDVPAPVEAEGDGT